MTAYLWHQAQAQLNPVTSTALGNGNGFAYFGGPASAQNPQTYNTAPVYPGGHALDYVVSKILDVQ
jgi:hypothetical protein